MTLSCLIIDDEPVARQGLQEYVAQTGYLELVASCENVLKASVVLNEHGVDLLYLDIHMPKVSGIEFLRSLRNPPMTILTTAYSEYAVEGYSLDVIDYLMKPITFERFLRATQKAAEVWQLRRTAQQQFLGSPGDANPHQVPEFFFVKCDNRYEKVFFREVCYIEALQNYVVIYTIDKKLITYLTLSGIEAQLPKDQFLKVHKSFIISVAAIRSIDGNEILIGTARIPISRNLKDDVMARILGNNLFRR